MPVPENYAVARQTSPDATATPFLVTLGYSIEDADDVSVSLLRSDNGEIAAPSVVSLASSSSINVTNTTGAIVEAIVIRVSDLSQDFNASNQAAIDTRSLVASQDKQAKAIQELKGREDLITSIEAFTIASKFVRKLKYLYFDASGDLEYVTGPDWTEILNKPDNFPTTWDLVSGKPTTFPPSTHTHPWSQITDAPDFIVTGEDIPWETITGAPDFIESVSWGDIADKPVSFAPSAHNHANENLGSGDNETTSRVQTIFVRSVDLSNDGTINLGNARLAVSDSGNGYTFSVYDSETDSLVTSMRTSYDPLASEPQATLTHFSNGNWHIGYRMIFGAPAPFGVANPFFRVNDSIAGSGTEIDPYLNDIMQLWMNGSQTFHWDDNGVFLCYDPSGTLGSVPAPWAALHAVNIFATDINTDTLEVTDNANIKELVDDEGAVIMRRTGNMNGVDGVCIIEFKDFDGVNTGISLLKMDEDAELVSTEASFQALTLTSLGDITGAVVKNSDINTTAVPLTSRNVRTATNVNTTAASTNCSTNGGTATFWITEGLRVGDSLNALEFCIDCRAGNSIEVELRYINLVSNADILVETLPLFTGAISIYLARQELSTRHVIAEDRLYFLSFTFNVTLASTDYIYGAQLEFDSRRL